MGKNMGAFRKGFTIIEVMLFLALSGLLLVGILGGLGGNIARQRYNDAVQDVVNMMRDQYSFVTDTEIAIRSAGTDSSCYGLVASDFSGSSGPDTYFRSKSLTTPEQNSFRGRTNCVVYGAVVSINEDYIETTELIGRDLQSVLRERGEEISSDKTDLEILYQDVTANNMFFNCNSDYSQCFVRAADNSRIQTTKWGTKLKDIEGNPLKKTLLIFRSPRDGSIRTYVMDGLVMHDNKVVKYADINSENGGNGRRTTEVVSINQLGIYESLQGNKFKVKDLDICVDSGDGQTFSNARRLIKVQRGGMGQSAVELMNLDTEKEASEGASLGETKCR